MKTPIKIKPCSCGCKHPKFYSEMNKEKTTVHNNEDGIMLEKENWFPVGTAYFGIVKCNVCGKTNEMILWGTSWESCAKIAIEDWNKDK